MMLRLYQLLWSNKKLLRSRVLALLMLIGSLVTNYSAGTYADKNESNYVTDIVLSNTRVYDVDNIFIDGIAVFLVFMIVRCMRYPQQMPYVVKSIALFILIRALFMSLTHLGPFPIRTYIDNTGLLGKMNFGADLFFSGHTGLPFLMGLIFRDHPYKRLRYSFLISSLIFAVVVLLGHLHYSIDVLSAFFITYTIHDLCKVLFATDKQYFDTP